MSPLSVGDAVERFNAGAWSNGWVVQDVSDPLSITIAKLGNPLVQFRNQRPDLDIRPCQSSPFAATTPEPDPFDF